VLGKKPAPTAKVGGRGSAKKDASYGGNALPMCMVLCTLASKGLDQVSWTSLPGSDAAEQVMPLATRCNGRPCAWRYAHWFPKDQIKYPGQVFQDLMLRNKPLRPMMRLSCPLLTCFRFEDGAQLRCSSAELFAHCREIVDCSMITLFQSHTHTPGVLSQIGSTGHMHTHIFIQ
jgi:hypothetical protein